MNNQSKTKAKTNQPNSNTLLSASMISAVDLIHRYLPLLGMQRFQFYSANVIDTQHTKELIKN